MKRLLLFLIALCCIPLFSPAVRACQCSEHGTPVCASFGRSDAVFVGRLVSITALKPSPDKIYKYVALHFVVEEPFKGISSKRVVVGSSTGNLCDSKFSKGSRYLVYASFGDTNTQQLFTGGICSPTGLAEHAEDAVNELRKITRENVAETISGRIVHNFYQGVPGIKIRVEGEGATLETTSSKYGSFSFTLPGPGQFKVKAYVPYETSGFVHYDDVSLRKQVTPSLTTFEYDLNLTKNECHYVELDVSAEDPHATATVSGRALKASGQPLTDDAVQLINTSETGRDYVELLSQDGSFTFKRVAPGEYYLAMNHNSPRYGSKYPTSYYPNVADLREATKITVKEGGSVENLTLQIGPERKGRRLSGVIAWHDGRKFEHLRLLIFANGEYLGWHPPRESDEGKFDLVLYGDLEYSVEAVDDGEKVEGRSERITVKDGGSIGVKLVLRRVKQ